LNVAICVLLGLNVKIRLCCAIFHSSQRFGGVLNRFNTNQGKFRRGEEEGRRMKKG